MITSKDLEKICNYVESTRPSLPQAMMTYIDHVEEPNDEYKRALKRKNRELAIDAILDDKVEEFKNREYLNDNPLDNEGYISSITPRVMSLNVQGKNYLDLTDIFTDVMNTLESLTSTPMVSPQSLDINIQNNHSLTDSENLMANSRRVISRIIMISNLISVDSRIGPDSSLIVGLDAYKYLLVSNGMMMLDNGISSGDINGITVIPSPYIKSNKIIIMRNNQKTESGLNVINCPNDMRYFLKETSSWNRRIKWFEII